MSRDEIKAENKRLVAAVTYWQERYHAAALVIEQPITRYIETLIDERIALALSRHEEARHEQG